MKHINPFWRDIGIAVIVLILIVCLIMCGKNRKDYTPANVKPQFDSSVKTTTHIENKQGESIAQNTTIEVSQAQIRALSDSIFRLKERDKKRIKSINSLTKIVQELRVRDIHIPFIEPDTIAATSDSIAVPAYFKHTTEFSTMSGRVLKTGVTIDSELHIVPTYLMFSDKSVGFLRLKKEGIVQAKSDHPDVVITGIASMKVGQRLSWFQRNGKYIVGIVAGSIGTYYITK